MNITTGIANLPVSFQSCPVQLDDSDLVAVPYFTPYLVGFQEASKLRSGQMCKVTLGACSSSRDTGE